MTASLINVVFAHCQYHDPVNCHLDLIQHQRETFHNLYWFLIMYFCNANSNVFNLIRITASCCALAHPEQSEHHNLVHRWRSTIKHPTTDEDGKKRQQDRDESASSLIYHGRECCIYEAISCQKKGGGSSKKEEASKWIHPQHGTYTSGICIPIPRFST